MEHDYDVVVAFIFRHLHLNEPLVKAWLAAHHLGFVWTFARDYLFDYRIWLLGFIPCVLLEHYFPAVLESENRRSGRWMDFWYPVFGSLSIYPFMAMLLSGFNEFFRAHTPFLNSGLLDGKPMVIQIVGAFLITDFMFYVSHFTRHKVRWFWHFHSIHHSQETLNPLTTNRAHIGEALINTAIRTVPIAFVGGTPINWAIFNALNGFWGFFIHANVRTNLGALGKIIVSPQFHRVHHSVLPEHFDMNFGERLVLWDWMFGTMVKDVSVYPPTGVSGIERWAVEHDQTPKGLLVSWAHQMFYPFYKIHRSVVEFFAERRAKSDRPTDDRSANPGVKTPHPTQASPAAADREDRRSAAGA